MPSQNPVFIAGPTNLCKRRRQAVNVPPHDRRLARFGELFKALLPGVNGALKTKAGAVAIVAAAGCEAL